VAGAGRPVPRPGVNEKRIFLIQRDDKVFNLSFIEVTNKDTEVKTLVKDVTSTTCPGWQVDPGPPQGLLNIIERGRARPPRSTTRMLSNLGLDVPDRAREEWRQMFTEAWRLERDYFYDTKMVGLDWKAMLDRYLALVDPRQHAR